MPRPRNRRFVSSEPGCSSFGPVEFDTDSRDYIQLTYDEFESLRLADFENLYHDQAAAEMNVSRQTFGRIIGAARHKIALALIEGKVLKIEGGEIEMTERIFMCYDCKNTWSVPFGTARPGKCPSCGSTNVHRHASQRGGGRGAGRGGVGGGRGAGGGRGGRGRGAGMGIGRGQAAISTQPNRPIKNSDDD